MCWPPMALPEEQDSEPVWRAGLRGARANLAPGLALQAFAVALVLAYYRWPAAEAALHSVTGWRARYGVLFPVALTALFGGVIPFLYLRARPATRAAHPWRDLWFFAGYWAYRGLEIDLFYRGLAVVVGTGHDVGTLAMKVVLDQFVYCSLVAVPMMVVAFGWRAEGYSWRRLRERLRGRFLRHEMLPLYIANCAIWIPAVTAIYALPLPLQLPLCNVVLCFYTLLVSHLAAQQARAHAPRGEA